MCLVLMVNLWPCCLNQLLKLSDLVLKKLDYILSGSLLSLKVLGVLECRFKLTGGGFEALDIILWDVGP